MEQNRAECENLTKGFNNISDLINHHFQKTMEAVGMERAHFQKQLDELKAGQAALVAENLQLRETKEEETTKLSQQLQKVKEELDTTTTKYETTVKNLEGQLKAKDTTIQKFVKGLRTLSNSYKDKKKWAEGDGNQNRATNKIQIDEEEKLTRRLPHSTGPITSAIDPVVDQRNNSPGPSNQSQDPVLHLDPVCLTQPAVGTTNVLQPFSRGERKKKNNSNEGNGAASATPIAAAAAIKNQETGAGSPSQNPDNGSAAAGALRPLSKPLAVPKSPMRVFEPLAIRRSDRLNCRQDRLNKSVCLDGKDISTLGSSSTKTMVTRGAKPAFVCPTCGSKCSNRNTLQQHIRFVHGQKMLPCRFCERSFKRTSELNRHVREVHQRIRPFMCKSCGATFKRNGQLELHQAHCQRK